MIKTFEYTLTDCSEQSGVEGFETVLETTDRKEREDLVENESLKDLRGSTEKRNGSIRPGDRGSLPGFKRGLIVARFQREGMTFNRMDWL